MNFKAFFLYETSQVVKSVCIVSSRVFLAIQLIRIVCHLSYGISGISIRVTAICHY